MRDRIVLGIRDKALSDHLQMDSSLTLETAKKKVRQREAVSVQGHCVEMAANRRPLWSSRSKAVRYLGSLRLGDVTLRDRYRLNEMPVVMQSPQLNKLVLGVARKKHDKGVRCPARDATCHRCNRKGHYSSRCFSKTEAAVNSDWTLHS